MFQRKTNKTVIFNQEVPDQTLLEVIEAELARNPHKTFSDLCKEALWQFLCVPQAVRPNANPQEIEQQIANLQRQLAELDKRISGKDAGRWETGLKQPVGDPTHLESLVAELQRHLTKESGRMEALERQMHQLNEQMMQLAFQVHSSPGSVAHKPASFPVPEPQPTVPEPPQEVDPLLENLKGFLPSDF